MGRQIAMIFNKRSTRTRVSTEAAVSAMGGHPMFLGKDDIQLGVFETVLTWMIWLILTFNRLMNLFVIPQ
jgi:ornithine carbamoyltransferase